MPQRWGTGNAAKAGDSKAFVLSLVAIVLTEINLILHISMACNNLLVGSWILEELQEGEGWLLALY